MARLGAVTAEALAPLKGVTLGTAKSELSRLARLGLVSSCRPLRDQPSLYTVTSEGMNACGEQGLTRCKVTPGSAPHLIACAAVAAKLAYSCQGHRLAGERELRRDEGVQGGPLASATLGVGKDGAKLLHRPDLVLWPLRQVGKGDGQAGEERRRLPVVVEVELTLKSRERLAEICSAWARCDLVAGVLYVAVPEVERALAQAIAGSEASGRIVVLPL
ncbi:MAG TPA: hypothetical protein VGF95_00255 [Solirubrobacteraceae bacterium]